MNVQVYKQESTLISSCKRVGSANSTVDRVWPAQNVYDAAVWEARNKTSAMGGDSVVILGSTRTTNGLANIITVQAVALSCN